MLRSLCNASARAWFALASAAARLRGRGPYPLLRLRIAGELGESSAAPSWRGLIRRHGEDYFSVLALLRWAREDPDLKGVVVSIDTLQAGWARLQGLRRNLLALRRAGKTVWVTLTHAGVREYYVATAADRVILTPAGVLDIAGLSAEATFFLGALEKLGVRAEVVQVGRFKSAGEPFTRKDMSPAHRQMIEALVDDLYAQIAEAVAEGRSLAPEAACALLGRGPFVAREALGERLIDAVAYADEAEKELSDAHGSAEFADRDAYAVYRGRQVRRAALRASQRSIALLHVSGPIRTGASPAVPGAGTAAAETMCKELEDLEKRRDIAAVVLRIDSPGGSGLASDLIWRGVKLLRAKKPVVVSLGDVAASGGYYIAMAGAPVVAERGTITGSIGVLAGKATLQGLYAHVGVSKEIVSRGEHAAIHSDYLPLGESERARLESEAHAFYDDFLAKVAEGRRLTVESVAAVAEGRIWTGSQALERRLVDQIGGIEEAIGEAKILAGIRRDIPVPLVRLPRPRRSWGLSLLRWLPLGSSLDLLSPRLGVALRERVWALLPFHLRFF